MHESRDTEGDREQPGETTRSRRKRPRQLDIPRRRAHKHLKLAFRHHPRLTDHIPNRHVPLRQLNDHLGTPTALHQRPLEPTQDLGRFARGGWVAEVDLRDFVAGGTAGVLDVEGDGDGGLPEGGVAALGDGGGVVVLFGDFEDDVLAFRDGL